MKIKLFLSNSAVAGLTLLLAMAISGCKKDMETDNSFPVNETFAMELMLKGVPADIARFFAAATMKTSSPDDMTCIYLQTFPNGASREMTLRVNPNPQYTPTNDEIANTTPGSPLIYGFKFLSCVLEDGSAKIELNYYVEKAALSKGAELLQNDSGKGSTELVGISWNEVWKKGVDWGIGSYIDYAKEMGIKVESLGSIYALASALSDVTGALDMSKQITTWLGQLNELEKCAANPTNPWSQKDPTYSATAVAMVQAARTELKAVNAVRYLNSMTETGAGINPVTAVLSVGLKPLFLWNDQTLTDYCENTIMREVRLSVVRCNSGWKIMDRVLSCDSPYGPWEIKIDTIYPDGTKLSLSENISYSENGISTYTFKSHIESVTIYGEIETVDRFGTGKVTITAYSDDLYVINLAALTVTSTSCRDGDCFTWKEVDPSRILYQIVPAEPGECTSHRPL